MLKRILAILFILHATLVTTNAQTTGRANELIWSENYTLQMDFKPIAFVQSLDGKKTFILGTDSNVHVFDRQGSLLGSLPVSPDVIDIDIEPRGKALYLLNGKDNTLTVLDINFSQQINITGAPVLGDPNAPVTLVEFSDFECPYCSKVKPDIDLLLKNNEGKLKVVFKHFPLRSHKQAQPAARAAIAAQKQGKFWEMHDALFSLKTITPEAIDNAAAAIGLNIDQYKKDKESASTRQQLAQDIFDGQQAEITGTPSLFINGIPVTNRSPNSMQTMIDQAIKNSGK